MLPVRAPKTRALPTALVRRGADLLEGAGAGISHVDVHGIEQAVIFQAIGTAAVGLTAQNQVIGDCMSAAGLIKNAGPEIPHNSIVSAEGAALEIIGSRMMPAWEPTCNSLLTVWVPPLWLKMPGPA